MEALASWTADALQSHRLQHANTESGNLTKVFHEGLSIANPIELAWQQIDFPSAPNPATLDDARPSGSV